MCYQNEPKRLKNSLEIIWIETFLCSLEMDFAIYSNVNEPYACKNLDCETA